MFRKFRVQNFMCLKDVTVELEPLTIFAGPNSSGKSALFKALTCLARLFSYPVSGGRTGDFNVEFGTTLDDVVWKGDSSFPIGFQVWLWDNKSDEPDYTLVLRRDYTGWKVEKEKFLYQGNWLDTSAQAFEFPTSAGPKVWSGPYNAPLAYLTYRYRLDSKAAPFIQPIQDLRMQLGQARRYRPSASDIASFVRPPRPPTTGRRVKEPEVDEAGRGLAVALRDLLTADRQTFSQLEEKLCQLHGHIKAMSFKSDWRGVGIYYNTVRAEEGLPAGLESDGVLLTTFLLWRLYTAPQNFKLCLEEPESGVHLWAMRDRYQLLGQFAMQNNNAHTLQILVATHSRDFLNAVRSRTDIKRQVRVVEFAADTGTAVHPLTHWKQVDSLLDEFKDEMGDLWWSERLKGKW